jgi:hypothetical protein
MNRNAVAPTIVICALILAVAGLVIVLKVRNDSSAAPTSPTTVTITATAPATTASTPASTPTPEQTSSAPASSVPLSEIKVCISPNVTCDTSQLKSQPAEILLSGDGSTFVNDISWTGWGENGATGSGTLRIDNCNPNCAQGTLTPYVATVTVSGLAPYGSTGDEGYNEMTVTAAGSPYGTHSYSPLLPS